MAIVGHQPRVFFGTWSLAVQLSWAFCERVARRVYREHN